MKKIIILVCLLSSIVYCQYPILTGGEISIGIYNLGYKEKITFNAVVDYPIKWYPMRHENPGEIITSNEFNTVQIVETGDSNINYPEYIYFDTESDDNTNVLAISIYKLTITGCSSIFYIDTRHCDDWDDTPLTYNNADHKLYRGNCVPGVSCNDEVVNGATIKPFVTRVTSCLEPTTPINTTVTNYQGHPQIGWYRGSNQDYFTGFDIYRSFESPHSGFSNIATSWDIPYIDNGVLVGPGNYVYYKVTTVNYNKESGFSNVASINYDGISKEGTEKKAWAFELSQNFPNPFNPSTIINYQIPEDGFVNLTVYNSLGEEVAVLVNTQQSRGYYNIEFDADNLPSGIYFYRVKTDKYNAVKKMFLIK